MYSLIKLAVASKQLPRMLYVFNVDIGGSRDPWRPGESLSYTLRTGTYGGAGGFADIYRATLNGKAVVLKRLRVQLTEDTLPDVDQVLPPSSYHRPRLHLTSPIQRFRREALVWRQLKHPYILPLLGIDADTFRDTGSLPCLVSPLMSRGTLRDYVRSTDYVPVRDFYRLVRLCHCYEL
jgi:serine/threonine protein kinase